MLPFVRYFDTLLPIGLFVASLSCDAGYLYLKVIKQSEYAASDESFQIMMGSEVVYDSPPFVNYELRELDICIPESSTRQYWLQLRDTYDF